MPIIMIHPANLNSKGELSQLTIERLMRGLLLYDEFVKKGISQRDIYFVSSMKNPIRGKISQSKLIKREIIKLRSVPEGHVIISMQSLGTWQDVKNSYHLIASMGLHREIYNVSSINHIWPRIRLIAWFWGKRYGVKSHFVSSSLMGWKHSFLEFWEIIKTFYYVLEVLKEDHNKRKSMAERKKQKQKERIFLGNLVFLVRSGKKETNFTELVRKVPAGTGINSKKGIWTFGDQNWPIGKRRSYHKISIGEPIGVYDRTNIIHLRAMLADAVTIEEREVYK